MRRRRLRALRIILLLSIVVLLWQQTSFARRSFAFYRRHPVDGNVANSQVGGTIVDTQVGSNIVDAQVNKLGTPASDILTNVKAISMGDPNRSNKTNPPEFPENSTNDNEYNGKNNATRNSKALQDHLELVPAAREAAYLSETDWINFKKESYSGMWWTSFSTFQKIEWVHFSLLENASYKLFRYGRVRKTVDWMDFAVTHLSVFWKHFIVLPAEEPIRRKKRRKPKPPEKTWRDVPSGDADEQALQAIAEHLHHYTTTGAKPTVHHPDSPSLKTLAIVPYYEPANSTSMSTLDALSIRLTRESLLATLTSLQNVAMGRCVVAVSSTEQAAVVRQLVEKKIQTSSSIVVLVISPEQNDGEDVNMPKLALRRLQLVQRYAVNRTLTPSETNYTNLPEGTPMDVRTSSSGQAYEHSWNNETSWNWTYWFGSEHPIDYWKYIYFTEPDLVLHTRSSVLPSFRTDILDAGLVLSAQRFQPLPHAPDLFQDPTQEHVRVLPHTYQPLQSWRLDPNNESQACCDQGRYYPSNPQQNYSVPVRNNRACLTGRFWWSCGFYHDDDNAGNKTVVTNESAIQQRLERKHQFIRPYPFLYWEGGTVFPVLDMHQRVCHVQGSNCAGTVNTS